MKRKRQARAKKGVSKAKIVEKKSHHRNLGIALAILLATSFILAIHLDELLNAGIDLSFSPGDAISTEALTLSYSEWETSAIADFDRDGNEDILFRNMNDGTLNIWYLKNNVMNGSAFLRTSQDIIHSDLNNYDVKGAADFDGNGYPDIILRHKTAGNIAIWYMNNNIRTLVDHVKNASSVLYPSASAWDLAALADIDGNNKAEILFRHKTTGQVAIWYMNNNFLISSLSNILDGESPTTPSNINWRISGAGDFNSDGKEDILWMNSTGGVLIWEMNNYTRVDSYYVRNASSFIPHVNQASWNISGAGDFNRDGIADIVFRSKDDGRTAIWYMKIDGVRGNTTNILNGSNIIAAPCYDSDNGINHNITGTANSTVNNLDLADFCANGTIISEARCDASNNAFYSNYSCPYGCSARKCNVPSADNCVDSDGGFNLATAGTANLTIGGILYSETDTCGIRTSAILAIPASNCSGSSCVQGEAQCLNSIPQLSGLNNCSEGCNNGACTCTPHYVGRLTGCIAGDKIVNYSVDLSGCSSELPENVTAARCDYNNNNVIGDFSEIDIDNIRNFEVRINDSTADSSNSYSGLQNIELKEGNLTRVSFDYNFTKKDLNLSGISITRQSSSSKYGYLIISGLSGPSKTFTVDRINASSNSVCVVNKEVSGTSAFSTYCDTSSEVLVPCDGLDEGRFTCTENDEGKFIVSGLNNSAVREYVILENLSDGRFVNNNRTGSGLTGGARACLESDWESTLSPEDCPQSGQQLKTWTKFGTCTAGITHSAETVSCTFIGLGGEGSSGGEEEEEVSTTEGSSIVYVIAGILGFLIIAIIIVIVYMFTTSKEHAVQKGPSGQTSNIAFRGTGTQPPSGSSHGFNPGFGSGQFK